MQYIQVNTLCERRFYEKYISRTVVTRQEISPLIWIFLMNIEPSQTYLILNIKSKLIKLAKVINIEINNEQTEKFYKYMKLLQEWNEKINFK